MAAHFYTKIMVLAPIMLGVWACSSTSDQEATDDINVGNNNTAAESINSAEGEEVAKSNEFAEGEEVNNASDKEFANDLANTSDGKLNLGNQSAQQNAPINGTTANSLSGNAAAPATNLAATDAATTAPVPTTPVPTSGGVVKFVKTAATMSEQPGGPSVGSLEKGDHPVVWDEGQYARLPDGRYVSASDLTPTGVGRERKTMRWRSGE